MLLETLTQNFRKARVTSAADNGFPSKIPTRTEPTGIGDSAAQVTAAAVFNLGGDGEYVQNGFVCSFFGTGTNNLTFSARAIGWKLLRDPASTAVVQSNLWVPVPLFEVQVTLTATQPGVAGATVGSGELFADTITLTGTTANNNVSIDITSPANDTIAHLMCDFKGFRKLEWIFTTGGSSTDCNAAFSLL